MEKTSMTTPYDIDLRLVFAILNGRVSDSINRVLGRNFRQAGLDITPDQWTILIYLWEKDGVTQQRLCNATYRDKPSMTRLLDNMERQHLVVRIPDRHDRRINLIYLTKDGKELEQQATLIINQTLQEALRGIGPEELAVSQEVLRKIFFNTKESARKPTQKEKNAAISTE